MLAHLRPKGWEQAPKGQDLVQAIQEAYRRPTQSGATRLPSAWATRDTDPGVGMGRWLSFVARNPSLSRAHGGSPCGCRRVDNRP